MAILISSGLGVVVAFGDAFAVGCCAPDLLNALFIFVEAVGCFVAVDAGFTGVVGAFLAAR